MLKKKLYCDLRARLLGTLGRWERGACAQAWALGAGRAGVLQARGARSVQAGERQACGARRLASGRRAGRAGQAGAGARPGRAGWLRAVHSAHFRSVLTRFFPESPNEHCSL